ETYVGSAQAERRVSAAADDLGLNQWTLVGPWTVGAEVAMIEVAGGSIAYRFEARDVNLVLAPPVDGGSVRFSVTLDGQAPGAAHGIDVDELGAGTLDEPRMYQLVRLPGGAAQQTFEITFHDRGARAYVFTFG